jgi:serine phosphatase RsbU (regulator of sigma subunit)
MSHEGSRVLVIDDDEGIRHLLVKLLSRLGLGVDVAEDGQCGLELLRRESYDLILLDYMMPRMNGVTVLAHIQADDHLRTVPVLIISAVDELALVASCIEMGAADYLIKPFEPVILRARVSACIEKKRLLDQEREHLDAIERELEVGRQIQRDFLPQELPRFSGWDLAVNFEPARQVAGDFYDAFRLGDDRLAIVIADVCDKGVGAALFMALTRTLIRVFANERRYAPSLDRSMPDRHFIPEDMLRSLESVRLTNDYIMRHHNNAGMFTSLFVGVTDTRTGLLAYVNAGHDAPLHVGGSEGLLPLKPTGPAIGLTSDPGYEPRSVQLDPGDVLCAFTDGLTEARNTRGEFFAERRLRELVVDWDRHHQATAAQLVTHIRTAVDRFTMGAEASDDITMLCLQRLTEASYPIIKCSATGLVLPAITRP